MNSERSVQGFPTIEEGPYVGSCAILLVAAKPLAAGLGPVLPRGFYRVCVRNPSPPHHRTKSKEKLWPRRCSEMVKFMAQCDEGRPGHHPALRAER